MTLGYSTYIWIPLFTFPTVEAPRFSKGYLASLAFLVAMWALMMYAVWYHQTHASAVIGRREEEPGVVESADDVEDPEKTSVDEDEKRVVVA